MRILTEYTKTELNIKNSRFLSEIFPCEKQDEARELIKSQKKKYSDSSHVAHAFVLGLNGEILGMSDDGEPSGTAGRPALDVLKGKNCTNIVLTITRWFGGTLLGTGGLVKAYGDSAKEVLEKAIALGRIQEHIEKQCFLFSADYPLLKTVRHILSQFSVSELDEEYGTEIKISGKIVKSEFSAFKEKLSEISNGKINL